MTLAILSGAIDLPVGAILGFAGTVAAGLLKNGLGCRTRGVLKKLQFRLNVPPFWPQVIKGGVILLAVAIDSLNSSSRDVP